MSIEVFGVVTAWESNRKGSLVLGVPKELRQHLRVETGRRFIVAADSRGRIIYTPKPHRD